MGKPQPKCPIRPGEPCTICQMGVTGPQDCGLVYLVMDDPEMRELWDAQRRAAAGRAHQPRATSPLVATDIT